MALQIATNTSSIQALNNLQSTDRLQQRSLERLSTGLRINKASDDPSGVVIAEQLRAQVSSINQAVSNSQTASNLLGTAEAALKGVNDLLVEIRESAVFALNSNSAEQIAAEQDAVDNALAAIDRIATTTRFGDRKLLNGESAIQATSTVGSGIRDIEIRQGQFDGVSAATFQISLSNVASRAGNVFASGSDAVGFRSATSDLTVRVTGSVGTKDIGIASGAGSGAFKSAVNAFTSDTGVYASSGRLYSVDFGSSESVSVEIVSGTYDVGEGTAVTTDSGILSDTGVDVGVTINGTANAKTDGNTVKISSPLLSATIKLDENVTSSSSLTFKIKKSGLQFQLGTGDEIANRERVGIRSVSVASLGEKSRSIPTQGSNTKTIEGFLSTLKSGGANDLSTDAANAIRVVDTAIDQVTGIRGFLGAFQKQTLESSVASLSIAGENLSASLSDIRDLDFASETAALTKSNILFQAGTSVLAQANQNPSAVLSLLR